MSTKQAGKHKSKQSVSPEWTAVFAKSREIAGGIGVEVMRIRKEHQQREQQKEREQAQTVQDALALKAELLAKYGHADTQSP